MKRFSRHRKDRGNQWRFGSKEGQQGKAKHKSEKRRWKKAEQVQFAFDKGIIKNTPKLHEFYLEKCNEVAASQRKNVYELAIELTKQFAKEQGIAWRPPK